MGTFDRPKKITPARARAEVEKLAAGPAAGAVAGPGPAKASYSSILDRAADRLRQAAPALVEVSLRATLLDPSISPEKRTRMAQDQLALSARIEDDRRKWVGTLNAARAYEPAGAEGPPRTEADVTAMEQEAERLRDRRLVDFWARKARWEAVRAGARAAPDPAPPKKPNGSGA
jgi:hypothetical protein